MKAILAGRKSTAIEPLPFNSGYFMSFRLLRGKAEDLRKALLAESGIGTIAIDERCLRVAFSSVDVEKLEELYDLIYARRRSCRDPRRPKRSARRLGAPCMIAGPAGAGIACGRLSLTR